MYEYSKVTKYAGYKFTYFLTILWGSIFGGLYGFV